MICDIIIELLVDKLWMNKNKIILSYDYELFFGDRSGTVLKSIIGPTNKLMEIMEHNGFRGNFFVDYLMFRELEKLKDERAVTDLKLLKDQVQDMVSRGHRVELHLHPHWIDAKYNSDGTWDFSDFSHYSLNSLDEETIVGMFKDGTEYLNNIAGEVEPGYKIVAFRAGGWAVQPFDKLKKGFEASGIIIDSSTSYGAYCVKRNQEYDFRKMPRKDIYTFSTDVCKEDNNGAYTEIPISSFHKPFLLFSLERALSKFSKAGIKTTDGTHKRSDSGIAAPRSLSKKITEKFSTSFRHMFNLSALTITSLRFATLTNKVDVLCFIDHPKDFCQKTINGLNYLGKKYKSVNYIDFSKKEIS